MQREDKDVLEEISYAELYDSRFAVIDVETTFSGETMSIGVVISNKDIERVENLFIILPSIYFNKLDIYRTFL